MNNVAIIGSTGSIGQSTLRVVDNNKRSYRIYALAAHSNISRLKKQIDKYKPRIVTVWDPKKALILRKQVPSKSIKILSGLEGLDYICGHKQVYKVVFALNGVEGLQPLFTAIRARKSIAMANKELLVIAGEIIVRMLEKNKVRIVPIDSEHSAIYQCIQGEQKNAIRKIVLTASGGPFLNYKKNRLKKVTPKEALNHPKWRMGKKISIDSATMMNKGLEVIEASVLYGIPVDSIDVLIHRQSIVHSLVEFCDNTMLAQLSGTDMYYPISYALSYPDRLRCNAQSLDLARLSQLTFEAVDYTKFPCLKLAYTAAKIGGTMPCVLNAANEVAVKAFLDKRVAFTDIYRIVERVLSKHKSISKISLAEVLAADIWAREEAHRLC